MWARMTSAALGLWLMAAPAVLHFEKTTADTNDRIVGPTIATFAIIAIWETTRELRWCNTALGLWLVIAPWVLGGYPQDAAINDAVVGILVLVLSLYRGRIENRYGGGWRTLWRGEERRS